MSKKKQKEKSFFAASVENFWYYYKWPFLGGIVLFFVVLAVLTWNADTQQESTDADVAAVFARPLTMQAFEFDSRLSSVISDTDEDGVARVGTAAYYVSEAGTSDGSSAALRVRVRSMRKMTPL